MKYINLILLVTVMLWSGCHTLDVYEWQGAEVLQGDGGAMRTEDGIEIWASGLPNRQFKPLEIVETTTTGSIGVQSYLYGVLKKQTVKAGGDGFILMDRDKDYSSINTSTTTHTVGTVSPSGFVSATSYTSPSSISVQHNTYKAMIFEYVE
tara:strand:- start:112 stop:564 length:453 start_codon:yes stop_codon:yes gene_type:complete